MATPCIRRNLLSFLFKNQNPFPEVHQKTLACQLHILLTIMIHAMLKPNAGKRNEVTIIGLGFTFEEESTFLND